MFATLHTYFRSSASYRVRIALNLKGVETQHVFVHLNRGGGEQFGKAFRALNPQSLVPVYDDGAVSLSQSLAIMEYLEDRHPTPPLLPASIEGRARARQLALVIACGIHPLNNLRVLKFLTGPMGLSEQQKSEWVRHWIVLGLEAVEADLARARGDGPFCVGTHPSIADCYLVPQLFSAQRFGVDLAPFPTLRRSTPRAKHCRRSRRLILRRSRTLSNAGVAVTTQVPSPFFASKAERVELARRRYFEEGIAPSGVVSDAVLQSWARCQRVHGDPAGVQYRK